MRQPLVVGNWKMNGTRTSARDLAAAIAGGLPANCPVAVGVCPSFVFIPAVAEQLQDTPVQVGAQNVADQDAGAFTGEVSAPMLKEFGCTLAIVGHSERRLIYGEGDALVAARYQKAIEHGICPLLCIGETLEQREAGETFAVVDRQLQAVLDVAGIDSLKQAVIAYEPVWAIGTGRTATPQQAQEVHAHIRRQLAAQGEEIAAQVRILYGGSVNADNAASLFAMADIDGGLIGGASLKADSFLSIVKAAAQTV
ncbi:triosephosphate isomerase [Methylomarinovum tepidoasis]|uniref:Triosephosphate isomerase n=1 Tax=Methylomarinovum tepidoasis TaxID=2840183 RepID=A0AAU9C899_9GAMM|nr:triose-phosphate isomerase [Methylomarinovum sp. IN45]BCX89907.1 triosephosphate isomerase [Methylomarinovum sp. IN45]